MNGILLLDDAEVATLLPLSEAIEVVEDAFRSLGEGAAINRPRSRAITPDGVLAITGPAALTSKHVMGFKVYSIGCPPHHTVSRAPSAVALYDTTTGALLALLAADQVSRLRTAAASAVSAKFMSRPESSVVGLIGSGWQATEQVAALAAVRPIAEVRVFSRDPGNRSRAAETLSQRLAVHARPVESSEEAVRDADLVVVITSSREPVLQGAWLADGCHVIAAGANYGDRRELDIEAVRRSHVVCVDDVDQARTECGDLIYAVDAGLLTWEHVVELGKIVAGSVRGRVSASEVTLFESQGIGLLDVAAAKRILDNARRV